MQIPIGNNTGSLPDLTSFHFPPPLPTPLDQEDPSSSPYSTVSVAVLSALSYFVTKLRLIVCHFLVALDKRCVQCIYGEISVNEVHEYSLWRFCCGTLLNCDVLTSLFFTLYYNCVTGIIDMIYILL